eukprot:TRINITY_DN6264_c0_g1_i1.p1 TRINITY_DN6264_c0_g1~~TRINITY_DN6264_c0_g1_i1.p1  ORF type:complete len:1973 (-),score=493.75 TRINITY_DN6264_c0_g1_i1:293-6211(-)
MPLSEDSFDAFLNADNDADEKKHLNKSKKGGIGRGADAGPSGRQSYDYSGGLLGRSGGSQGVGGSYQRGVKSADYDPLAHIDLDAYKRPTQQQGQGKARQQQDPRASAASSASRRDGTRQESRYSTGSDYRRDGVAAARTAASRSRERRNEEPERRASPPADGRGSVGISSSSTRKPIEVTVSDSEDAETSTSKGAEAEAAGPSIFESMMKDMAMVRESAELERKRAEEEKAEAKRREEERKREEEERIKEEMERKREEEERKRKEEEEVRKRKEEEERKRKQEEEERKRKAEEERIRKEEEERQRKREEEERKRKEEEEERKRKEEERKRKDEEERKRKEEEEKQRKEDERKRKEEEDRKRIEEEQKRKDEERRRSEEEARRKEDDDRRMREDETRQKLEEESRRSSAEDAQRIRDADEARKKAADEAAKRKADDEARARDMEEQRRRDLEDRLSRQRDEEGASAKRDFEEQQRKEEERRRRDEEDRKRIFEQQRRLEEEEERQRRLREEEEHEKFENMRRANEVRERREQEEKLAEFERARSAVPAGSEISKQPENVADAVNPLEKFWQRESGAAHAGPEASKQRENVADAVNPLEKFRQRESVAASAGPAASLQQENVVDAVNPLEKFRQRESGAKAADPLEAFRQRASGQGETGDPLEAFRQRASGQGETAESLDVFRQRDSGAAPAKPTEVTPPLDETCDSITLVASVRDPLATLRRDQLAAPQQQLQPLQQSQPLQASTGNSFAEMGGTQGGWSGKLMQPSTESAEEELRRMQWRTQQLQQQQLLQQHQQRQQQQVRIGGCGPRGSFTGAGHDPASSLLLGSTVCSDVGFMGLTGALNNAKTLRPEEVQDGIVAGVSQRIDRVKLEALQGEIQGLKRKVVLLDEINSEMATARVRAETHAAQADEQMILLRLENKRLQDTSDSRVAVLREASVVKHELERRLETSEAMLAERTAVNQTEAKSAKVEREQLLACIASQREEVAGLREERDTLRDDLAVATETLQGKESNASGAVGRSSAAQVYPNDEKARLRAELEMTEKLLSGCEKENESLALQNRQLRQSSRLRKEEVDGRQLKLVAELNAARASADANPASMRRVSELERELVVAKERADEHARELERCREQRRQLEREILTGPAPSIDSNAQQLAEAAENRCARVEAEMSELREKIWVYADSQKEMEEDRKEVARLAEQLRNAQAENAELRRRPSAKEAGRRVAELRRQVDELQECLRKRHPDSLLSLVKACEPRPEERKEVRDLRAQVEQLEAKLEEREALYDRQVRALRAQYDHIRHEYERRTETRSRTNGLEAGGADDARRGASVMASEREIALQARIKDLEKQVEHTKNYYVSKMRKKEPLIPAPKPSIRATTGGAFQQQRESDLLQCLQERDARIEALSQTLSRRLESQELHSFVEDGNDSTVPKTRDRTATQGNSLAMLSSVSMLRLFLASPEAPPLATLSSEVRAMSHAAHGRRFGDLAAQARSLHSALCAEEETACTLASASSSADGCHDPFKLKTHPPLPGAIWASWRRQTEQLVDAATNASRLFSNAQHGDGTSEIPRDVINSLRSFRTCVEAALAGFLRPAGGGGVSGHGGVTEAWSPQPCIGSADSVLAATESVLPRLLLERVQEELDFAGTGTVTGLLQDVEVHAGLDHKLPWSELLGVLERASIGGSQMLQDCRSAANPTWSFLVGELSQHLLRRRGVDELPETPCATLLRTLTRVRVAAQHSDPPLPLLFRRLDAESRGFVPRPEFLEVLRGLRCVVSPEERVQLASYFAPAAKANWVCYPLFLHSITPLPEDVGGRTASGAETKGAVAGPISAWAAAPSPPPSSGHDASVAIDALARVADAESESATLRDRVRVLTARCAEHASLIAQPPVQMIHRLQAEVAVLESRVLEQQTALAAGARKAEITLRAELDVARHEVVQLRRQLDTKNREVTQYQGELESIIGELTALRGQDLVYKS